MIVVLFIESFHKKWLINWKPPEIRYVSKWLTIFLTIIYWQKEEKLMKRYLALFHVELHFVLSGQSVQ